MVYPKNLAGSSEVKTPSKSTSKTTPTGKLNIYTVQSGDSLWIIAQKYPNVSVQNIKDWNDIWSAKSLKIGTKLKIYTN